MRKSEREVHSFDEIVDIFKRADTLHLGLNDSPYPYVVPMSYGFEAKDGKLVIYIHGAKAGLKHDLIARDNHVCVEVDILHNYAPAGGSLTAVYESAIGYGQAVIVEGDDEIIKALDLLLAHCGSEGLEYDHAVSKAVRVYKIELTSFTGKRRTV
jgi:nitroimidazol reductase NimA-like FMN-containing flavoprotein (pyridoxamine 5'-phosphate oxidase superfamily)